MKSANGLLDSSREKPAFWNSPKRYYDFRSYLRNTFGARVAKLTIDGGFTCPNRDGRRSRGGCIYCDGRGSALRQQGALPPVTEQLRLAMEQSLGQRTLRDLILASAREPAAPEQGAHPTVPPSVLPPPP